MYPFRDTQDQSILDNIDSNRRQLFIRLGRDLDENTKQQISKQIASKANLSKQLRPYQRYNKLKKKEKQIRLLLESTEKMLQDLMKKRAVIQQQTKELNSLKQQYIRLMGQIKRSQQLDHKIQALNKEKQILDQIYPQLQPQIENLKSINFTKDKILSQKKNKEEQLQKLERKSNYLKNQLEQQRKLYQKFSLDRIQFQDQLNQLQGKRIAKQITNKTIKQILLKSQLLVKKQENEELAEEPDYRRLNRSISHNIIVDKAKVPLCYWYWTILLIIWSILLFLIAPKVKRNIYDDQCL